MKTFAEAEEVLAAALPGYESRLAQQNLAAAIETIMSMPENFTTYDGDPDEFVDWVRPGIMHLLGQAGCGTGKSLAYLIPSILSGKRIVVSVTTKALQDQIVGTDIPFLTEHLSEHKPFTWALLKGRSNYLCLNRLRLVTEQDADPAALRTVWAAYQNADSTFTGMREEIGDIDNRTWALVCSDSDECASHKCKAEDCYAKQARKRAEEANLVIVNHALFFSDLALKAKGIEWMLGLYDMVVFDEAHSLEEVAGNSLGGTLSAGSYAALAAQARNWGATSADDDGNAIDEARPAFTEAANALFAKIEPGRLRAEQLNQLVPELGALLDATETMLTAIRESKYDHAGDHQRAMVRKAKITRQCLNLKERLTEVIVASQADVVRWVEMERRRDGDVKVIKTAPIHVAPFLFKHLYSKTPVVHVSATLAVKGNMAYIANRLGIHAYGQIDVGTPFDFTHQGRLFIPDDIPAPQGQETGAWQQAALLRMHALITASRGRALVLFTSIKHMRETYDALQMMSGDLVYRMQGERGATNQDLVNWLKDHETGGAGRVLLATKSFFTGIDIPGDALSLVIVTKMPFPVPNEPLTEARCEAIEMAGGSAFADYSIPVMSLELQQAVGRLIRHRNDKGVAAILDPRLATKGYGRQILRDLPPMPRASLAEIGEFFAVEPDPVAV